MSDENARPSLKEQAETTSTGKEKELKDQLANRVEDWVAEKARSIEEQSARLLEEATRLKTEGDAGQLEAKRQRLDAEAERLEREINYLRAKVTSQSRVENTPLVETANKPTHRKKRARANLSRPSGPRTVARAAFALELLADAVPKRINTEQIGDALERIHQLAAKGSPKWVIYFKVVTTYWWVFLNTLLHYGERIAGIVQVAIGKGDNKE